jgi:hypothetical protein
MASVAGTSKHQPKIFLWCCFCADYSAILLKVYRILIVQRFGTSLSPPTQRVQRLPVHKCLLAVAAGLGYLYWRGKEGSRKRDRQKIALSPECLSWGVDCRSTRGGSKEQRHRKKDRSQDLHPLPPPISLSYHILQTSFPFVMPVSHAQAGRQQAGQEAGNNDVANRLLCRGGSHGRIRG